MLAEAIARYHQQCGEGNLAEGISAARRALKLWPKASEAIFWEGMCHSEAGRAEAAKKLFSEFVAVAGGGRKLAQLLKEAKERLAVAN